MNDNEMVRVIMRVSESASTTFAARMYRGIVECLDRQGLGSVPVVRYQLGDPPGEEADRCYPVFVLAVGEKVTRRELESALALHHPSWPVIFTACDDDKQDDEAVRVASGVVAGQVLSVMNRPKGNSWEA